MRNVILGVAALLVGVAAIYVLSTREEIRGSTPSAPATVDDDPPIAGGPTDLAALQTSEALDAVRTAAPLPRATLWLVEVEGGEPGESTLAECRATLLVDSTGVPVESDASYLTGAAGTPWDAPLAGTWELTVKVAEVEKARRQVVLPGGRATRTLINLDALVRLDGWVRNVLGEPCPAFFVGFVPRGGPAPTSARDWLDHPHARCDARGRFNIQLPRSGTFRPFAGYGGRVLVEDSTATKLLDTSSRFLTLTTPVPTRLTLIAREEVGDLLPTGYAVSVYRRKAIMDLLKPLPPEPEEQPIPDPDDPSLDADQRSELLAELEAMKQTVDEEAALRRRRVVPEGWRVDRSGVLSVDGELQLTDLPAGEELRFAAARGGEPFFVTGSAFVDPLLPTRVILTFPPALAPGTPAPTEPRSASLETQTGTVEPIIAPVGVTWR
ncbi:hypothetical protein Poly30_12790 [Planctomycetes bacterium Poly30]|uniref:Uncharacterized protein n=1 Tax=Saltatorellus ferox TaxID=2528018 RepID=A0A518ENW3_9BACT|nr:hypothetical protein Poly30_12790 [Planctomycetes bacterium Poly30]